MSRKSDNYARHLVETFAFIVALPMQIASMWLHPFNRETDWAVLALLALLTLAHFDTPSPDPD